MTTPGERSSAPGALSTRPATPDDLDAFLGLARQCASEAGRPFDDNEARWLFGGIARSDPAIHLLAADKEIIGFSIIRSVRAPLTGVPCVREELVFVQKDRRSATAELLLHGLAICLFEATEMHSEISLLVPSTSHCLDVIERLRELNLYDAALLMTGRRPTEPPGEAPSLTRH